MENVQILHWVGTEREERYFLTGMSQQFCNLLSELLVMVLL